MTMGMNKALLIGNVGRDPEIRTTTNGKRVSNLILATTEEWKDSNGEKKTATEWHRITVWGGLVDIVERYVRKGSRILVGGKLQTRKYMKDGIETFTTEVVLQGYGSELMLLDSRPENAPASRPRPPALPLETPQPRHRPRQPANAPNEDDDIPF